MDGWGDGQIRGGRGARRETSHSAPQQLAIARHPAEQIQSQLTTPSSSLLDVRLQHPILCNPSHPARRHLTRRPGASTMATPLTGLGVVDLLEADPRPSFIVALEPDPPSLVYTSPAFNASPGLLDLVVSPDENNAQLWDWITAVPAAGNEDPTDRRARPNAAAPAAFPFAGVLWTQAKLQPGLVVLGANEQLRPAPTRTDSENRSPPVVPSKRQNDLQDNTEQIGPETPISPSTTPPVLLTPQHPVLDHRSKSDTHTESFAMRREMVKRLKRTTTEPTWTMPEIMPDQRLFLDMVHSIDWSVAPLGPIETWPPQLQQTVNQILADTRPMALYWGPSFTTIYNEPFSRLCGSKHPSLLGKPVEETWPEAAVQIRKILKASPGEQRRSVETEQRFYVEREDGQGGARWLEELHLRWSLSPIHEGSECMGFLHPVLEVTSTRLWERRMQMLINLGESLVTAPDVKSYWDKTLSELEAVEPRDDIPMAILYSVDDGSDSGSTATTHGAKRYRLAGSLGVPPGHPLTPSELSLQTSNHPLAFIFQEAILQAGQPLLVQTADGTLPQHLLDNIRWRGFGDPCRAAVVCPIRPTRDEEAMGLLFLGLNPRRPYDEDYRQYIWLLSQKLTTSLASTVLIEEEARRNRKAAKDTQRLREQLDFQKEEANKSTQKFQAVAEFIPVGMSFGDPLGNITFANDAWYRITGLSSHVGLSVGREGFLSCVKEEDHHNIIRSREELKTAGHVTFDFRVKKRPGIDLTPPPLTRNSPSFEKAGLDLVSIENMTERHVLATSRAEKDSQGNIIQILTCLTDVTLHKRTAEEAIRRAQQAENLKRMAEAATVGMYDMDLHGRLLEANNVFFEMCGLKKVDLAATVVKPWETCLYEEDIPMIADHLQKMMHRGEMQTVEVRLKTKWQADDGAGHTVEAPRWVQATLMPVRSSEGVIQSFTGCLSDVSLQRWQLEREKKRKDEAIESKRQQENFIDMTSHEMRNPLSAIIHCADAIIATLARVQEIIPASMSPGSPDSQTQLALNRSNSDLEAARAALRVEDKKDLVSEEMQLIENSIDSAETIVGCAQHQKRIVDDILTMSKLDSKLLAVTPITVNPIQIMQDALKMFEVEARRVDISLSMIVDKEYHALGLKWLNLDPSRLKQVLINLLTNALKFTKSERNRNVSVAIKASRTRPSDATSAVQFIPRSEPDVAEESEELAVQNSGEPVYLLFEVKDTGQGLTEEEKNSLFQRFVQASSRTHVKYGGSGLGLFISRRLTELQNGAIGVASQVGVGSTFAFFIETREPTPEAIRKAEAAEEEARAATELALGPGSGVFGNKGLGVSRSASKNGNGTPTNILRSSPHPPLIPPEIKGVLIVEDNLINQQITRRGLTTMGYTCDVANHGVEALEKLRLSDRFLGDNGLADDGEEGGESLSVKTTRFPLSVILMDIEMPIQNGLTCTRNIRALEKEGKIRGGRLPIIAVSANARNEQILEAKEAGCDDVLVKPYRMPELIEKMKIVMAALAGRSS
ncbi:putative histidine kinase group protein [Thozetella sp. PMI_491]|nr:putative histidine kinase group protein [Thozetella sp. PMI_491]